MRLCGVFAISCFRFYSGSASTFCTFPPYKSYDEGNKDDGDQDREILSGKLSTIMLMRVGLFSRWGIWRWNSCSLIFGGWWKEITRVNVRVRDKQWRCYLSKRLILPAVLWDHLDWRCKDDNSICERANPCWSDIGVDDFWYSVTRRWGDQLLAT